MATDIGARIADIYRTVENAEHDRLFSSLVDFASDFGNSAQRQEAIILAGSYIEAKRDRRRLSLSNNEHHRRLTGIMFKAMELIDEITSLASEISEEIDDVPQPPGRVIYVSYAWADETDPDREKLVDRLMADATTAGIPVARDKDKMSTGDRISTFMGQIGRADKIVVFLSAKYLRSAFCMNELYQIWVKASCEEDNFANRIAVFALDDADVWALKDRALHARYWQDLYKENAQYLEDLGERDRIAHLNMKRFAVHVGDILASITDTVLPQNYEELKKFAFGSME